MGTNSLPDGTVFRSRDTNGPALPLVPDQRLDVALCRQAVGIAAEYEWLGIRSTQVEQPDLLLMSSLIQSVLTCEGESKLGCEAAHGQQILRLSLRTECDRTDNVIVCECVDGLSGGSVPDFATHH